MGINRLPFLIFSSSVIFTELLFFIDFPILHNDEAGVYCFNGFTIIGL